MKPEEVTQFVGALTQGLTDLEAKLQQPAEQVFELFVRQNYIKGIINIVATILGVIITIFVVMFNKYVWKKYKDDDALNEMFASLWVASFFIIFTIWVFVFISLENNISRFINPNYMALKDILELIKTQ